MSVSPLLESGCAGSQTALTGGYGEVTWGWFLGPGLRSLASPHCLAPPATSSVLQHLHLALGHRADFVPYEVPVNEVAPRVCQHSG